MGADHGRGRLGLLPQPPISLTDLDLTHPPETFAVELPALVLVRREGRPVDLVLVPEGSDPAVVLGQLLSEPAPAVQMPRPRREVAPRLTASVVVTTIEPSDGLERTLRGICASSVKPNELLVVDNRPSTSGVREFLQQLSLPDGVVPRYVPEPVPGLGRARNAGLMLVDTDIVAFTDDDVVVDRDWLSSLQTGFEDDDVGCVTGLILPAQLETRAQVLFEEFGGYSKGFVRRRFGLDGTSDLGALYPFAAGIFGSGANAAFRADVLRSVGGFDEFLGAGTLARGGEDLDIFLTVIRSGHDVVYEPAALLRHEHLRSYDQMRRKVFSYGVGLGAMLTKRIVTRPDDRREMVRRVPAALRHLLSPKSAKNAGKSRTYPRELTALELAGIALGPIAYARSRLAR